MIEMRTIRKVYNVTYTFGMGDDAVTGSEVYEDYGNAIERMSFMLNSMSYFNAEMTEKYEVGENLGVYAGTLVDTLGVAERFANKTFGSAVL